MSSFSLNGASFAFRGFSPVQRNELSGLIQAHEGQIFDEATAQTPHEVYVITNYWSGSQPSYNPSDRPVTRFWFSEILRLRRWLRPDAHPFFEPPPKATNLQMQQLIALSGNVEVDDDGDVKMDTLSQHKMLLPHSPTCRFRDEVPVWPYFAAYLAQPMHNVHDLAAILQLTTLSDPRRRFNCLEYAVNELLTVTEQTQFFQIVLPKMVQLVLSMPQMFATPPTLLTPLENSETNTENSREKARVVTQSCRFSKLEVLTLVCGCFFGIFPEQDITKQDFLSNTSPQTKKTRRNNSDDVIQFPYFTAVRMFSATPNMGRMIVLKGHKIRCLLQYFLRVVPRAIQNPARLSAEIIDFTRVGVSLRQNPKDLNPQEVLRSLNTQVETCAQILYPARCVSDTLIEDLDRHLQIDFANKFPGGGVLNSGCVQEEIRFLLSPELLVACLVFARLESHESFVVHGTERYSCYRGYGGSFEFGGNFEDSTRLIPQSDGKLLRQDCVIVGIDATDYGQARVERQYTQSHVWRDLVKAYVGFAYPETQDTAQYWPVATGNWGCGVFQGDRELKFLIQWLAASLRHRELVYVLFERDLDLLEKVKPLLALATGAKAQKWDRQNSGLMQWLVTFLFKELNVVHRARGGQSVLVRAAASLERVLVEIHSQDEQQEKGIKVAIPESSEPQQDSPLLITTMEKFPGNTPKREDESDESSAGLKKKPKMMKKELQQRSIQDFFTPK